MSRILYKALGEAKCEELAKRSWGLWHLLAHSESRKNASVLGVVVEGLVKDFIREFLPAQFSIKSGLIFDAHTKEMSPQIDAIVYRGVPLLGYTDAAIVETEQVRAAFEIKSVVTQSDVFGALDKGTRRRNPETGLASQLRRIRECLPKDASLILFTFELHSAAPDKDVVQRLSQICDRIAVVIRREPRIERLQGKPDRVTDFADSVSTLIEWLRGLE